ncbi:MAG: hypothetical protein IJ039_02005 [Clostridia bacterium]|nr:hypothetical protein [Clostridia bacterium]
MEENKRELIEKLRNTHRLWNETNKAKQYRYQLDDEEAKVQNVLATGTNQKIKGIIERGEANISPRPQLPKEFFNAPPQRPEVPDCRNAKDVMMTGVYGLLVYAAFIFWIALFVINKLTYIRETWTFAIVAVFVALLFPWITKGRKRAQVLSYEQTCKEYEQNLEKWEKELDEILNEEEITSFLNRFCEFDSSFVSFLRNTDAQIKDEMNASNEKKHMIYLDYSNKKREAEEHIAETERELEAIGIVTPTYYYLAHSIADVLENGRADTLKEALNIAIEDERREREEQQRREEADRQAQILERQAEEARRHNREMERAAKEQAEAAERNYEENRRHNREMERNSREQQNRSYGNSICLSCANYAGRGGSCNGSFVKNTGTCGSFRS